MIRQLKAQGIPVVAVFLSGRPLWVNREINAADAFVAAWLPGSEGEGVADVLLRTRDGRIAHDFHGRLAYAWPRTALPGQAPPQFPIGYGLRYTDHGTLPPLPDVSGIHGEQVPVGNYLERGKPVHGYAASLVGADGDLVPANVSAASAGDGSLRMSAIDYHAQEDSRRLAWTSPRALFTVQARAPLDLDRQTNGDVLLVTTLRVDALPRADAWVGLGCGHGCQGRVPLGATLAGLPQGQWVRVGVPLKCFRAAGADMHHIDRPFELGAGAGTALTVFRVALGTDADQVVRCPR